MPRTDRTTVTGYTAQQRLALLLLTSSYACAHLDRNIVTILLAPIKAEFGVSDTALGLLTGLTFAVFHGVLGIPLAYLADRANRRHLLAASLMLFSAFTAMSGFVSSFGQLVAARIGVGVGEGGAVPAAQSIIADTFEPEQRFFAVGIYSTGASIGALLGLLFGCGGAIGILLSSYSASRMSRRSIALALVPPIVGCCLVGIFSISMTFAPSRDLALLLLLIPAMGYCCHIAPLYGVIHAIVQNRVRARAIAFLLLAANIAGFGFGPLFVGLISDSLSGRVGAASLSYALLIVNFGWLWAAAHFWIALQIIRAETSTTPVPIPDAIAS